MISFQWKAFTDYLTQMKDHFLVGISKLLKIDYRTGCAKMSRCKAHEILRNEAYIEVRRSDEE